MALLTHGYGCGGGVDTVASWLRTGIGTAGHEVDVYDLATARNDPRSKLILQPRSWKSSLVERDASDSQLYHVGAVGGEVEPLRYLPRRELTARLSTYDIVQVVSGSPAFALPAVEAGVPIVIQAATTVSWEREALIASKTGPTGALVRAMTRAVASQEKRSLRSAAAVMVENAHMAQYVRAVAPTTDVVLAPPGVDVWRFSPNRKSWDRGGYLLSVCRLSDPRKGLHRLLEAYSLLRRLMPTSPDLVLAGSNEPPASLTALAASLGLADHVRFMSNVSADRLPDLYRGASVFLQTSYEEGLGLSVLEAMASGLPVVATATAGSEETVLPGVTGWLIPQAEDVPRQLALRIRQTLNDGESMAFAARDRVVQRFASEATLGKFLDTYGSLALRSHGIEVQARG
ncbi:glycosyltransferase family 4 protein [Pedococcus sp. 2YAF34]|uniref:glycosyltransferase family 4 protein n=1 Tax=Pedococcus sp. 2YAF34 TaxID=3233032 RepID=UPI003F9B6796